MLPDVAEAVCNDERKGLARIASVAGGAQWNLNPACQHPGLVANLRTWSFAVIGGLCGQVGGVFAGFDRFRANPTKNPEALARATSGGGGRLKLQLRT
jgi:hypothetical protein